MAVEPGAVLPERADFAKMEEAILKHWESIDAFQTSLRVRTSHMAWLLREGAATRRATIADWPALRATAGRTALHFVQLPPRCSRLTASGGSGAAARRGLADLDLANA